MRTSLLTALTRLLGLWFRRASSKTPFESPARVLVIKPCCLGDVLLTTPLVAQLRISFPDAQITYAVGRWSRPMVASNPHIDATLPVPERWTPGATLAFVRALRAGKYDAVFVPERTPLLTLLVWLAAIPRRVGLDSRGRGFAYTHRAPVPPFVVHEADLYSSLATAAGLPPPPRRLFFAPDTTGHTAAAELLAELDDGTGPLIVLHPGGGQNPGMTLHRKRWFPERWAVVADTLIAEQGARVLVVGGPGDEAAAAELERSMRYQPVATLVRRWDWSTLAALIQSSALFLGHDTGMMHLAAAVGTPTLAIFGPSDPQMYGPYGAHGRAIWHPTHWSPCFYDGAALPDCPCNMQCMRNVDADEVVAAARDLLQQQPDKGVI